MSVQKNQIIKKYLKATLAVTLPVAVVYAGCAFAGGGESVTHIGEAAESIVTKAVGSFAKLTTAGSYVTGMILAMMSIFKFKAHKDNPGQNPLGTPVALMLLAAALIFLPTMFGVGGKTIFGTGAKFGGVSGTTEIHYQ